MREYSIAFDKADVTTFEVSYEEKLRAVADLDPQTREDTEFAIANVRRFAEAQLGTILPLEIEALPGLHLGPACTLAIASSRSKLWAAMSLVVVTPSFRLPS